MKITNTTYFIFSFIMMVLSIVTVFSAADYFQSKMDLFDWGLMIIWTFNAISAFLRMIREPKKVIHVFGKK